MLFSATLSNRVMELAYEHMNNPQVIRIEAEHITADKVRQGLYHVSAHDKIALLLRSIAPAGPQTHHDFCQHQAGGGAGHRLSARQRL
jgi:ATP-dependent RNA helicase RhlB